MDAPGHALMVDDGAVAGIDSLNCVRFEARGLQHGAVTIRDLVRHALRHRPDHIVVGEVRGGDLPWDVTCRGVVDGIAMVIHMTRADGRRCVEEAAYVNGYDAGRNQWDIQRLERLPV